MHGNSNIKYMGDFSSHLFRTKRTHWAMPATSNSVVAACSASVLVSRFPFKFYRGDQEHATEPRWLPKDVVATFGGVILLFHRVSNLY